MAAKEALVGLLLHFFRSLKTIRGEKRMTERIVGKVRFCNPVSGVGMVKVEDVGDVFFHVNDLPINDGFKAIIPGKRFEFDLVESAEGKPRAEKIRLLEGTGVVTRRFSFGIDFEVNNGFVCLRVDTLGRITAVDENPLHPDALADGYVRAYYGGLREKGEFKGFNLRLPEVNFERAIVVADSDKNPRVKQAREYKGVKPGSYLVSVDTDGKAIVHTIGFHLQSVPLDKGDSRVQVWIVIHPRFKHQFDIVVGISEDTIRQQIPIGGMARDNDGFARAIAVAFQRMAAAQKPAPAH